MQIEELEEQIIQWRGQAPDGILKRFVVGGFSMRDIEMRVSDISKRQDALNSEMDKLAERIKPGSSYIDDQSEKIKLEIEQLKRQLEMCEAKISTSLANLNDTKNQYEVFRLFQMDALS